MPIAVLCESCGASFNLRDELAGRKVRCAGCQGVIEVPAAPVELERVYDESVHPAFQRDKYLLRQKLLTIGEKYLVWDEAGNPILFIERRQFVLMGLLSILAAVVVFVVVLVLVLLLAATVVGRADNDTTAIATAIAVIFGVLAAVATTIAIYPKRHIHVYGDESKQELLLELRQDQKWNIIWATFTLLDPRDGILCRFRKNYLLNFVRRRWDGFDEAGRHLVIVKEDSLILSLLRRVLGTMFGLLRTNFVMLRPDALGKDGAVIGEFNRKFTLLDRYVLDLSADRDNWLDRRVAVVLGVLLDTGERR